MKKTFGILTLLFLSVATFSCTSCSKDDVSNTDLNEQTEHQKVFNEFWDIYDRHYPLMHRKNINWQTVYDTYYTQTSSAMSDAQLFEVFNTIMSTVIKDGHSGVALNNSQETDFDPGFNQAIQNMIENNTENKVNIVTSSANNPYLSYGTLVSDPTIGYINSKMFEPINDTESEFDNFKSIVDEALVFLQNKTGVILDIRTNGGGQGPFAYYLAGRFFSTSTPIELVRMRYKTSKGSTESSLSDWVTTFFEGYPDARAEGGFVAGIDPSDFVVNVSGAFQFTNKVAVLTSKGTASAAEYFTAAMKTQTHVRTIGNTTFGIFAGSENLTLKQGSGKWSTRISVQDVELKFNGIFQSFEGIGITPDAISIPTTEEVSAGNDTHIDEAVQYILN